MTNNPAVVEVTEADETLAKVIMRNCVEHAIWCASDVSYELARHRIAAEKRRQDVTALYAYEAGFEGAESILREHADRLAKALRGMLAEFDADEFGSAAQVNACYDGNKAIADYRKFSADS